MAKLTDKTQIKLTGKTQVLYNADKEIVCLAENLSGKTTTETWRTDLTAYDSADDRAKVLLHLDTLKIFRKNEDEKLINSENKIVDKTGTILADAAIKK